MSLSPLWMAILRRCDPMAEVKWAVSCEIGQNMIREANSKGHSFDVVITDLFLAGSGTGIDLLSSQDVQQTGAVTMLVTVAEQANVRDYFKKLPPETVIVTKPIHLMKCEALIGSLIAGLESTA